MDPVSTGLLAVNVVGSLLGGLGASRARRRAEEARNRTLQQYLSSADADLQGLRARNSQSFWGATGQAGDALRALSANTGANMAAAGVHNSSATAGAIAHAQDTLAAQLADLASTNFANESALAAQNRRWALGQQLGFASDDVSQARAQQDAAQQALIGGLVSLASAFAPSGSKATPAPDQAATGRSAVLDAPAVQAPALQLPSLQSLLQSGQQSSRAAMGFPDVRSYLPITNGVQGAQPVTLRLRTPVRRLGLSLG